MPRGYKQGTDRQGWWMPIVRLGRLRKREALSVCRDDYRTDFAEPSLFCRAHGQVIRECRKLR